MTRRRRQSPADVEVGRWADALAARKRAAAADLDRAVAEQNPTTSTRRPTATAAELRTIRRGQRAPRVWDEINSCHGGGRDFRRPT